LPPATNASSQSFTCDVDIPRICRTASMVLLKPWMKLPTVAALVLQTGRPLGHSSPPFWRTAHHRRAARSHLLQADDHQRCEEIVEEGDVDVRRLAIGHGEELARDTRG
jgi:hypothetical protein